MTLSLVLLGILFILLSSAVFIVHQQTAILIERFGKFSRIARPGLNFRIPIFEKKVGRVNLKIQQLDVNVETKTEDNVFVKIEVAVQYRVMPTAIFEAFYKLESQEHQIQAFVFDVVRAKVPAIILDDVFSKKDDIAHGVRKELQETMSTFGYEIIKTLVTDIQPNKNVKDAMNEINTAQRLRIAAQEKGEAEKIVRVKQAEAEAEANILHGKGISGQRKAIIEGLSESLVNMQTHMPEIDTEKVMDMILLIQYFDMLRELGSSSNVNTVFIPHSPGNVADMAQQIRETIFSAKHIPDGFEKIYPKKSSSSAASSRADHMRP
ncbi:MAG: Modulator of FtsH protease HflK [Chlamydiae bacterium]|nr:Modulator of FtsH protease HflK [Chlamydiota bacterium]